MPKEILYKQCKLRKITPTGEKVTVTWLPEKFAIDGTFVKLKNKYAENESDKEQWEDGWEVISGQNAEGILESYLNERSRDYTRTRDASDI